LGANHLPGIARALPVVAFEHCQIRLCHGGNRMIASDSWFRNLVAAFNDCFGNQSNLPLVLECGNLRGIPSAYVV
jgi:hypothetical protein